MKTLELIKEIKRLSVQKRIYVIGKTIHSIRKQENTSRMSKAANLLLLDYKTDTELTAFVKSITMTVMKQSEIWLINPDQTIGAENELPRRKRTGYLKVP